MMHFVSHIPFMHAYVLLSSKGLEITEKLYSLKIRLKMAGRGRCTPQFPLDLALVITYNSKTQCKLTLASSEL